MTSTANDHVTLSGVLFSEGDAVRALRQAMRKAPALGAADAVVHTLGMRMRDAALHGVADEVARMLDLNLIAVIGAGWRRYDALTAAGRRTLAAPGVEEIVELAEHRIRSTHRPRIDIIVDEVQIAQIDMEIEVNLDLHAASAVLFAGRLIAVRSGRASVAVGLTIEGVPIASANRELDLDIELPLGSGIPLAEAPEVVRVLAEPAAEFVS